MTQSRYPAGVLARCSGSGSGRGWITGPCSKCQAVAVVGCGRWREVSRQRSGGREKNEIVKALKW